MKIEKESESFSKSHLFNLANFRSKHFSCSNSLSAFNYLDDFRVVKFSTEMVEDKHSQKMHFGCHGDTLDSI